MKKLLFCILLFFWGLSAVFAQAPTHEQLTYQTVVRNAQNQLVFGQDNITVTVEVCNLDGSVLRYSEMHTGLSTNANGLLTLMVGSGTLVSGAWTNIDWSDAAIRTTISYDHGSGTVTIPSGLAPVSAVPYALQAGNATGSSIDVGAAIHDSIVNNISSQIHDSIVYNINNNVNSQIHDTVSNYLTNNHYVTESNLCTAIEINCANVALRNGNTFTGDNDFTGAEAVTVPNAITPNLATTLASACTQEAVNLCDLFAVFDSLNRRINSVYDSLQRLNDEITALKNAIPPMTNAPTVSNVSSASMNVKANATSDGAAITSYEFCISTNSDMSGATCQTLQASDADNYTFTGLTPNTNYYVQYSATNFAGTATSSSVQQRTPSHAPTADVMPPSSTKPAGFKVEVADIDPKEKTDATTLQVCYTPNTGTCPDKESTEYANCKIVDATGITDTTVLVTGLTPSSEYCVVVKVSNGDSTTIYGPYIVTTGAVVTLSVVQTGDGRIRLCGNPSADVTYTATPSDGENYTYSWSGTPSSISGNRATYTYTSTNTYTVTVTAENTEGYTLTATASTTVHNGGGTAVSIGLCESEGIVTVKTVSGRPNNINWGDGHVGTFVSTSNTHDYTATLASGAHTVIVSASNANGCTFSRSMTVNVLSSVSTVADRTVKPCSVGSHAAQTGSAYTGNGYSGRNHGLETINSDGKITSVTDYDGNEYPVVQIGSQCWLAENLRCTHSPKTGSYLVGTPILSSGSKLASWYDNDQSSAEAKRYGLLYNWCASMDTANPSGYVEVATSSHSNNYNFDFTPSGNHQGICPTGWHVPTDAEWNAMELEVTGSVMESTGFRGEHAGKLSTGCDWSISYTTYAAGNYAYTERNSSGFSTVPAGYFSGSSFTTASSGGYLRSSTQNNRNATWYRSVGYNYAGVFRGSNAKSNGLSVRCVRD